MDNIILQKTWVQGCPVIVDNLLGTAFTGEAQAHTFVVSGVDAAQEPVTITGTITGKFLAANNVTVPLTGSLVNGAASVTLTDECYDVPGRYILSIYATNGSTTQCLYCAVGNVFRTDSQTIAYPSTDLPNITTLMAQLEEILDGWPADYSQLQNDVSSLKSAKANYANIGFNQWDEYWEIGGITETGADNPSVTNSIRSGYIPVTAGLKYFFESPVKMWVFCYDSSKTFTTMLNSGSSFNRYILTIPTGTAFIRFGLKEYGTTYNNDVCINISQPDTTISPHNGDYVAYANVGSLLNRVITDERDEKTYRAEISTFNTDRFSVADVPGVIYVPGYSANATNSTTISMTALASMDSYVFFANNPTTLYFDTSTGLSYLALCYCGNGSYNSSTKVLTGTGATRVRNLNGDLPTQQNPLTLAAGSGLIITLDAGSTVAINANGIFRTLSNSIILGNAQITQIEKSLDLENNRISFDGTTFTLKCGNFNYYIVHDTNNDIRQNTWRIKRGAIVVNGAVSDMWNGSDADGVVMLSGENDFIGGHHGDEITTALSVFIDGVAIDTSVSFAEKSFETFAMYVQSNVYHCIDSASSSNIAFTRNKIIFVEGNKVSVSNYWKASESVNVQTAYFGMCSIAKALVTNYSLNSNNAILNNTTQGAGASYCDRAKMFLNTGNVIEYYMSERSAQAPFGYGQIYNGSGVSDRVKAYFAEIYKDGGEYVTLNTGDIIRATATMAVY